MAKRRVSPSSWLADPASANTKAPRIFAGAVVFVGSADVHMDTDEP